MSECVGLFSVQRFNLTGFLDFNSVPLKSRRDLTQQIRSVFDHVDLYAWFPRTQTLGCPHNAIQRHQAARVLFENSCYRLCGHNVLILNECSLLAARYRYSEEPCQPNPSREADFC